MDREETAKILSLLRASYPKFYAGMKKAELENIVSLWQEMFDEPYQIVAAAVKGLISTDCKGFPPVIGQVKEKIRQLTEKPGMTELEAWDCVSAALRNSTYGAKAEFAKLPPEVQAVVHSPDQLRAWAGMEASEVQTIVSSNFQRSYRGRAAEDRAYQALPESVKQMHRQLTAESVKPMPELPPRTEQGQTEQKEAAIRKFKSAMDVRQFLEAELGKAFAAAEPAEGREMSPEEAAEFERKRREAMRKIKQNKRGED